MSKVLYLSKRLVLLAFLLILLGPLAFVAYHHFYLRGLQAEAQLFLAYLNTLQKAYAMEQGGAAFFPYYGATVKGQDLCQQPLGAAQLGFLVPGCHDEGAPIPRYAFRSVEWGNKGSGYQLQAISGSDREGRSLVCFQAGATELWISSQNGPSEAVESCW